jgi:hypothetical protein
LSSIHSSPAYLGAEITQIGRHVNHRMIPDVCGFTDHYAFTDRTPVGFSSAADLTLHQ